MVDSDRVHNIVINVFLETISIIADEVDNVEEPNLEAKFFMKW